MIKTILIAAALASFSTGAFASADLARQKACMACHAADRRMVGPAYQAIAQKYAADSEAIAKLVVSIRQGGVGKWGQIPMPAQPNVSEEEAKVLAEWIMSQK